MLEVLRQESVLVCLGAFWSVSPVASWEAAVRLILNGPPGIGMWDPLIFPSELSEARADGNFLASATGDCSDKVPPQSIAKSKARPCQIQTSNPSALCSLTSPKSHLEDKPVEGHEPRLNAPQLQVCLAPVSLHSDKEIIWLGKLRITKIHSLYIFLHSRQISRLLVPSEAHGEWPIKFLRLQLTSQIEKSNPQFLLTG